MALSHVIRDRCSRKVPIWCGDAFVPGGKEGEHFNAAHKHGCETLEDSARFQLGNHFQWTKSSKKIHGRYSPKNKKNVFIIFPDDSVNRNEKTM